MTEATYARGRRAHSTEAPPAAAGPAYHVVVQMEQRGNVVAGSVAGPCVTGQLWPGDRVIAGPFDDLVDAQVALLVHVEAYPDAEAAKAALGVRWGRP